MKRKIVFVTLFLVLAIAFFFTACHHGSPGARID
jgi:hypothetical protein